MRLSRTPAFVACVGLLLPNRVEFLRQAPLGGRFALAPFEAVSIAVVVALRNHVADVHVELAVRLGVNRQPAVVLDALGALLPLHLQFVILHGLGVGQVGHDGVLADGLEVRVSQHRAGPVAPVLLNRVGNRVQDGNPSIPVERFAQLAVRVDGTRWRNGKYDRSNAERYCQRNLLE